MSNASIQTQLLAAVNAKLQTHLTDSDVEFGVPEFTGATPNSQVRVTPSPTCTETFDTVIKYDRVDLADVATRIFAPMYFDKSLYTPPLMLHDILDHIATLTGVTLSTDDVVNVELTSSYPGNVLVETAVNLVASDSSFYVFGTGRMPYVFDYGSI